MTLRNHFPQSNEDAMDHARQEVAVPRAKAGFNVNKLQAVACMLSSAAVSIALIYWAIRSIG